MRPQHQEGGRDRFFDAASWSRQDPVKNRDPTVPSRLTDRGSILPSVAPGPGMFIDIRSTMTATEAQLLMSLGCC